MSKAFTKDEGAPELLVVPRAPLPDGAANYVTARGLRRLHEEHSSLEQQRARIEAADAPDRVAELNALGQRAVELQVRIASAELVQGATQPQDEVRFGATVRVRRDSGVECRYRIVGVDEADAARGLIAFCSPLARALLGKRVGESAELWTPRETNELEILALDYDDMDREPRPE